MCVGENYFYTSRLVCNLMQCFIIYTEEIKLLFFWSIGTIVLAFSWEMEHFVIYFIFHLILSPRTQGSIVLLLLYTFLSKDWPYLDVSSFSTEFGINLRSHTLIYFPPTNKAHYVLSDCALFVSKPEYRIFFKATFQIWDIKSIEKLICIWHSLTMKGFYVYESWMK